MRFRDTGKAPILRLALFLSQIIAIFVTVVTVTDVTLIMLKYEIL